MTIQKHPYVTGLMKDFLKNQRNTHQEQNLQ